MGGDDSVKKHTAQSLWCTNRNPRSTVAVVLASKISGMLEGAVWELCYYAE